MVEVTQRNFRRHFWTKRALQALTEYKIPSRLFILPWQEEEEEHSLSRYMHSIRSKVLEDRFVPLLCLLIQKAASATWSSIKTKTYLFMDRLQLSRSTISSLTEEARPLLIKGLSLSKLGGPQHKF